MGKKTRKPAKPAPKQDRDYVRIPCSQFRLEPRFIELLDRIAGKLSNENGIQVSRTDAVRSAITIAARFHGVHESTD